MKTIRHLHLVGATGTIRTAVYDNREHLVVPVVAMVEGVVWAVNSDVPEFVPAEELAETPYQWNGRGCFAGHPEDGDGQVTANTPRTLEKSFGLVFDAADSKRILSTRRLELFAWLDPAKAELVGVDAADVVRRLKAGEVVEVSVGCYVEAEDVDGTFNGKPYHGVWRNIVSDHLAFLASDETGACSVNAGCGAGRTASQRRVQTRHLITAEGIRREEDMATATTQRPPKQMPKAASSVKEKVKAFLKTLQEDPAIEAVEETAELIGFNTISSLIDQAVVALGEASKSASALILDEGTESSGDEDAEEEVEDARIEALRAQCMAVYGLLGNVMDMCWQLQQDEENDVQAVYVVNAAKRIAAEAGKPVDPTALLAKVKATLTALGATPCACGGHPRQASGQPNEKEITMDLKARIAALMTNEHNPLKDEKYLLLQSDEGLKILEAHCANAKTLKEAADKLAADEAAAKPKAAEAKPMTEAEALKMFPSIGAIVERETAREATEKAALVSSLKACGVKTEAELGAMALPELRTMAAFAKVAAPTVDYSGMGAPRLEQKGEDFTPPDSYAAGLKALKDGEKSTVN